MIINRFETAFLFTVCLVYFRGEEKYELMSFGYKYRRAFSSPRRAIHLAPSSEFLLEKHLRNTKHNRAFRKKLILDVAGLNLDEIDECFGLACHDLLKIGENKGSWFENEVYLKDNRVCFRSMRVKGTDTKIKSRFYSDFKEETKKLAGEFE